MSKISRTELFEQVFGLEFCDEIEQIGSQYSEHCWQIGDKVADALAHLQMIKSVIIRGDSNPANAAYILAMGSMDVYRQLSLRFGIAERTLRDYHSIAVYYSQDERGRFEVLPFAHFRFAKSCGADLSTKILELSLAAMDGNGGRPPSVAWLEVNLHRVTGDPGIVDDVAATQDLSSAAAELTSSDFQDDEQRTLPSPVFYFLGSLKNFMLRLKLQIEKAELPENIRYKIDSIIELSEELADELMVEIDTEREN